MNAERFFWMHELFDHTADLGLRITARHTLGIDLLDNVVHNMDEFSEH